jgi:ABC-type lipoprotein export system ATPase subunit
MALIECKDLCRSFRDPTAPQERRAALVDVTFQIERGEFVAVVGPSGSGKSTLLNLLGGLDVATSGELRIDDVDLSHATERELDAHRRDRVGFVFQSFHLNPRRTALENVTIPLVFSAAPNAVERGRRRLEEVGLGGLAERPVSTLSGGQRQRVAIARALVHDPSLLLADEPVGNLDAATGKEIVDLLVHINRTNGVTVLAVSHDAMLLRAARRMLELAEGRLQVHSSTRHLRGIAALDPGDPQ